MAERPLTDNQIDDMLFEMQQRLRGCRGVTKNGETVLRALELKIELIRQALVLLSEAVGD